jgi:hypothetical protein
LRISLLEIIRKRTSGEVLGQERFEIKKEEFAKVWLVVVREKLISFTPVEEPEAQVIDFGEYRLRVEFIENQNTKECGLNKLQNYALCGLAV